MDDNDNQLVPLGTEAHAARGSAVRTIIVNGRQHRFRGDEIGSRELVRLAYPAVAAGHASSLTVAYECGPIHAPSGLLAHDRTVPLTDGQTFSVSLTDKS